MGRDEVMVVDERKWLSARGSGPMLDFLCEDADPRKVRLFACAVGRHLPRLRDRAEQEERDAAIAVAEHFADGLATQEDLRRAFPCSAYSGAFWSVCLDSAWQAADLCARETQVRSGVKAQLLRDLFGNPWRPVVLEPAWLTADVVTLARADYDERLMPRGELGPARLAVLVDALLDAGCTSAEVLAHLRGPGPHVSGCVAVDCCLGLR
jgi:hypothetical protein